MSQYQINISAPNLAAICIDQNEEGEMSGRLFHCYTEDAIPFSNSWQLLKQLEQLYDSISFPQAATEMRFFIQPEKKIANKPLKVQSQEVIIQNRGALSTFVVYVRYRQNSTWQGEVTWVEKNSKQFFSSTLEFVKLLDNALAFL